MSDDCEWCNGKDAPGEHENFCRLGLGPDEKPRIVFCGNGIDHPPHRLTMAGDVKCEGPTVGDREHER